MGTDHASEAEHRGPASPASEQSLTGSSESLGFKKAQRAAGMVLSLQRAAGNGAVVALLSRVRAGPSVGTSRLPLAPLSSSSVQRAVTVDSSLAPAPAELREAPALVEPAVAADALEIARVQLPAGIRPPTRLEGSQGRHTVAWAARMLEWASAFKGPVSGVLREIYLRADDDKKASASTPLYSEIKAEARALAAPNLALPESEWVDRLSKLIADYVHAYQLSDFAVFASTNPKGHGEASALSDLAAWSAELESGAVPRVGDRPVTAVELLQRALKLLDTHGAMSNTQRYKAFKDWLALVRRLYPGLFVGTAEGAPVLRVPESATVELIKELGLAGQRQIEAAMVRTGAVRSEPVEPVEEIVTDEEAAEEQQAAADEAEGQAVDAAFGTRSFVVGVDVAPRGAAQPGGAGLVPAEGLTVASLRVANERAQTQFGRKQGNHVVAWSLERLALERRYVGKRLSVVLEKLRSRILVHGGTPSPAVLPDTLSVGQWKSLLDRTVEETIRTHQRSAGATFGAEPDSRGTDRPEGHGEAQALARLRAVEAALTEGSPLPTGFDPRVSFGALIDLPQLESTRSRMGMGGDLDHVLKDWKKKLTAVFPRSVEAYDTLIDEVFTKKATATGSHLVQNELDRLQAKLEEVNGQLLITGRRSTRNAPSRVGSMADPFAARRQQIVKDINLLSAYRSSFLEREREAALKRATELRDARSATVSGAKTVREENERTEEDEDERKPKRGRVDNSMDAVDQS